VILTENTFGDILSDVAAGSCGGLGVAASASLGELPPAIFEPVHGSAPDIAGQGIANPTGALRSVALLLRHAAGEEALADELEQAIDAALQSNPTRDLGGKATTIEFTDTVLDRLATKADAR
jgi:3-isopropylmalate dehydrogenase